MLNQDYHQLLMKEAYNLWTANAEWPYKKLLTRINYPHQVAVVVGNLNYQVENGGFAQWYFNGYYHSASYLLTALEEINTNTSREVKQMVENVLDLFNDDNHDHESARLLNNDLSTRYYEINNQFMADTLTYLQTLKDNVTHV